MNKRRHLSSLLWRLSSCLMFVLLLSSCSSRVIESPSPLVQIGSMRESIGKQQHQGRIRLAEILREPHFYGVGALAELEGEVTIIDSTPIVTLVGMDGKPMPASASEKEATMLIGQSVQEWKSASVTKDVSDEDFDELIAREASASGVDTSRPFIFLVDGVFIDVHAHVINGACPIHARMQKLSIEDDKQPCEFAEDAIKGTVVGVYAADSVGKLTHPATSTHTHLIYSDSNETMRLTAHIEKVGIAKGSVLKFPAMNQ